MESISRAQVRARIRFENSYWTARDETADLSALMKPRAYFRSFFRFVEQKSDPHALRLMGPCGVGKTVLLKQAAQRLIRQGTSPRSVCYLNISNPLYGGLRLEELLTLAWEASGLDAPEEAFVFLDDIHYLADWETGLEALVKSFPTVKFVACSSVAPTFGSKQAASGAGPVTDFLLPPLTFYEYLDLRGTANQLVNIEDHPDRGVPRFTAPHIDALNEEFVRYLNFGGYLETVLAKDSRTVPALWGHKNVLKKVLLSDLPSLYGIQDVWELSSVLATLASNTADEVSVESLSQIVGVTADRMARYLDYLEAAFLIKIVQRVDRSAAAFQPGIATKVFLTSPCLRSAFFAPLSADDPAMGSLVETAVFAQWLYWPEVRLNYLGSCEVDLVQFDHLHKPLWGVEVKWSDRYEEDPARLGSLLRFCNEQAQCKIVVTTRTKSSTKTAGNITLDFVPASLYSFLVGYNRFQCGGGQGRRPIRAHESRHEGEVIIP
jgi:predicted AAA+ superfamily ATPase